MRIRLPASSGRLRNLPQKIMVKAAFQSFWQNYLMLFYNLNRWHVSPVQELTSLFLILVMLSSIGSLSGRQNNIPSQS